MVERDVQRLNWHYAEWGGAALVFGLLLAYPLLNGFPFLFPDFWGYSGACPDELRSPVLGCAMRPFTWVGGIWAYAVVQCAVTAFAVWLLWAQGLKRRYSGALFAAVLTSGLGLFAGWVMADVWTLIGLIGLFVIARGNFHPAAAAGLAFACGTHFGNFPAFGTTALLMLPFIRQRARYAVRMSLCFAAAVALIVAANLIGGRVQLVSGNGFVFLASRILHDLPEVLELKCRQDPQFPLCRRQDEVRAWSAENHQSFTWVGFYNLGLDWPEYNRICRELVRFSLRGLPAGFYGHAAAAVRNTGRLLFFPELSNGFETFGPESFVAEDLRIAFPEDLSPYLASRQASGELERLLKRLDAPFRVLIRLSIAACLMGAVAGWARRRDDPLIQLALFAVIAFAANAFFMANLSGVFGRYQARMAFLPVFAAMALLSRWGRGLWRAKPS
jgi:hypothetical protein